MSSSIPRGKPIAALATLTPAEKFPGLAVKITAKVALPRDTFPEADSAITPGVDVLEPVGDVDDAGSGWAILDDSNESLTATGTSCPCCGSVRAYLFANSNSSSGGRRSDPVGKLLGDSGS